MSFWQDLLYLQQEHQLLFLFFTFVVSLNIGSFLNVVIYRLPEMMKREWQLQAKLILAESDEAEQQRLLKQVEQSPKFNLAVPVSTCPKCQHKIRARENIPLLSYLLLKGKCANCQSAISIRYPLIELATAVLASLVCWQLGWSAQGLALIFLTYILMALFWIDVDHQLLPDSLTLPLMWLGILLNVNGVFTTLEASIIGAMLGYLSLWSVYWLFKLITGKEGMGFGDFKLMAAVGAWFGWTILPQTILWSAVVGAIVGISLVLVYGRDAQKPMPYGPFIAVAAWLLAVYGQQMADFTLF